MARNNRAKPQKQGTISLRKREIEKIKKDATVEAVLIAGKLAVALMAENHNLTEDEIFKDMQDYTRWAFCVHEHILDIKEVDEIYEKKHGMKFEDFREVLM